MEFLNKIIIVQEVIFTLHIPVLADIQHMVYQQNISQSITPCFFPLILMPGVEQLRDRHPATVAI